MAGVAHDVFSIAYAANGDRLMSINLLGDYIIFGRRNQV